MPSVPEIVVQIPLPSVLEAVTIAPTTGIFAELLTTPAMAPNMGCAEGAAGALAALASSASAGCGPLITVRAATIHSAETAGAGLDVKYLFIIFSNVFLKVNRNYCFPGLAFRAGRNACGGLRTRKLCGPLKAANKRITVMSSIEIAK